MSFTETSSVLSDTVSDDILTVFDELISSSERLVETIQESSHKLESIQTHINSNNAITVSYDGWSGDFEELLETLHQEAKESDSVRFGDILLSMLDTAIIHE